MHTRAFRNSRLGVLVFVRPLEDGDVDTISCLFGRLSPASRVSRFVSAGDRAFLARVDDDRHVLVAHVGGDPAPAAIARLVRCPDDPRAAEIAFEVADCYQGAGIRIALLRLLLAGARAAGCTRVSASVEFSNRSALRLLRRLLGRETLRVEGAGVRAEAPLEGLAGLTASQ